MVVPTRNTCSIGITGAAGTFDDAVPDRASACNTDGMIQRRVIGITRPDTDHDVGRVANRPVIHKVVGCASFGSHLVLLSIGLLPIVHGEDVVAREFNGACRFIREYRGHQVGNLWTDHLDTIGMCRIEVVEIMTIVVPNIQDSLRRDVYTLVGEDLVRPHHLDQRNTGSTQRSSRP